MEYIEGREYILTVKATRYDNFFLVPGDMCTMIEEACVIDSKESENKVVFDWKRVVTSDNSNL